MAKPTVSVLSPLRHSWLKFIIKDLETNPHTQYKVHFWGVIYWLINFPLITLLFFLAPGVWLQLGIFITLIYSIYANFATDYGAMSAAMAAYGDNSGGLPALPMVDPQATAHYSEAIVMRQLLEENTRLTAQVKSQTDLLGEIHKHLTALTPNAGEFAPETHTCP